MTQIFNGDIPELADLPITTSAVETLNRAATNGTEDVLSAVVQSLVMSIAQLEIRLQKLTTAVGAVEVRHEE